MVGAVVCTMLPSMPTATRGLRRWAVITARQGYSSNWILKLGKLLATHSLAVNEPLRLRYLLMELQRIPRESCGSTLGASSGGWIPQRTPLNSLHLLQAC